MCHTAQVHILPEMSRIDKAALSHPKTAGCPPIGYGAALFQLFSQNLGIGSGAPAGKAHAHVRRGVFADDEAIQQ